MPARIAHRFARDISNGPSFSFFLNSSEFRVLVWHCEGVVGSGALLEDMAVWEQVTRLVAVKVGRFQLSFGIQIFNRQQIVENLAINYNSVVPHVIMRYNALYRNILVYHHRNFGSRQRVVIRYNSLSRKCFDHQAVQGHIGLSATC